MRYDELDFFTPLCNLLNSILQTYGFDLPATGYIFFARGFLGLVFVFAEIAEVRQASGLIAGCRTRVDIGCSAIPCLASTARRSFILNDTVYFLAQHAVSLATFFSWNFPEFYAIFHLGYETGRLPPRSEYEKRCLFTLLRAVEISRKPSSGLHRG